MKNRLYMTRDILVRFSDYFKGNTLDLGAGTAKYKNIIKPKTTSYTTYDMIPGPNIDIVGDILNLELKDNTYDTVISTQVLEHVSRPWIMAKEISRILKSGGHCIVTAPFLVPFHSDPHDYFRYTTEGMSLLFSDAGLEIIDCKPYGGVFMVISEYIHFRFFNPYNKELNKIQKKTFSIIQKILTFFEKIAGNTGIAYANVYLIAKKK